MHTNGICTMKFVCNTNYAIDRYRKSLVVYRASLMKALVRLPSPNNSFTSLLAYAQYVASQPVIPIEQQIAWQDVIQFERLNPDVLTWSPVIGLTTPTHLDLLFEMAIAIEQQNETVPIVTGKQIGRAHV